MKAILFSTLFVFALISSADAEGVNPANYAVYNTNGSQTLLYHVPAEVASGKAVKISPVSSNQTIGLRVLLASKNQAGLDGFIQELYDPKSPQYHHFLTPAQFALQYGASSTDAPLVQKYLKSLGLSVVSQSKNGFIINATGPVSAVESAFKVNINYYKRADGTTFYAPDSNPTITPQVAGKIYLIAGMDNVARFHAQYHRGRQLGVNIIQAPAAVAASGAIILKNGIKPQISPPPAPTGLTATASDGDVILYWNASATASSYNIYRSTTIAGTFTLIASSVTTTNYSDAAGLANLNTYYYKITAVNAGGESGYSNEVSATPFAFLGIYGSMGPADIADAYNLKALASNGSGQTLGLYELDGYKQSDITTFENNYGLPNVALTNVYTDGYNGAAGVNTGEVVLDIDVGLAAAPGLSGIRVYEAPNTGTSWVDQWDMIVNDPNRPKIVSVSWGAYEAATYAFYDHSVFAELAALGVTVFASAGDSGAYDNCDNGTNPPNCTIGGAAGSGILSVGDPASDPYVTSVGISILSVNNAGTSSESYKGEEASLFGGGGVSSYVMIPSFQAAAATSYYNITGHSYGSTSMRNVPDVTFTADPATSYGIYITDPSAGTGWFAVWGSSAASPIWAGFMTRVNEGRAALGETAAGWINPAIYQFAQSSDYSNVFHDITAGINNNYPNFSGNDYYPAKTGYDDSAGLGSFNGANFYSEFLGPAAPTGLNATAGNAQIVLNWTASPGAASYNVDRSTVNGGPYTLVSTNGTVTTANYTDTSLTNGQTYYYVVNGVNHGGIQGPNSAQASATPQGSSAPGITTQPGNQTVTQPAAAIFTIVATGVPAPTYQWMESVNGGAYVNVSGGSGATSASYTTPATTVADSGTQYKCVVTNNLGSVTSSAATLTVNSLPSISVQPSSQTVTAPATATFTLTAGGTPAPTYQWMESVNGGAYVNVSGGSGATSASYTTPATTGVNNATQYECAVTNAAGSVTSNVVTLTVDSIPVITVQPGNQTVTQPAPATFTVTADGAPAPAYQWMESVNGGAYVNVSGGSGATSASYTTPATLVSNTGTQFECVITNGLGSVTSNAASLTVLNPVAAPTAMKASILAARLGSQIIHAGVTLSWRQSTSPNIAQNKIYRSAGVGPYSLLATISASTSYVDKNVVKGTVYSYEVAANNPSGGQSNFSNSASIHY